MAQTIASLGLAINSAGAAEATANLEKMAASATKAESATEALTSASASASAQERAGVSSM